MTTEPMSDDTLAVIREMVSGNANPGRDRLYTATASLLAEVDRQRAERDAAAARSADVVESVRVGGLRDRTEMMAQIGRLMVERDAASARAERAEALAPSYVRSVAFAVETADQIADRNEALTAALAGLREAWRAVYDEPDGHERWMLGCARAFAAAPAASPRPELEDLHRQLEEMTIEACASRQIGGLTAAEWRELYEQACRAIEVVRARADAAEAALAGLRETLEDWPDSMLPDDAIAALAGMPAPSPVLTRCVAALRARADEELTAEVAGPPRSVLAEGGWACAYAARVLLDLAAVMESGER